MPGGNDPLYVEARRALLDALDALGSQREAVTIVGAQAIYLHTGEGDLAVAPYTTDGDLSLAPASLSDSPTIAESMHAAGFSPQDQPGSWRSPTGIEIDLMVPSALGGKGSRGARLGPHGKRAARKAKGLEATLVDRSKMRIASLSDADSRQCEAWVAGLSALLVAKLHKIAERIGSPGRQADKDALDVLRILRHAPTDHLATSLANLLHDPTAATVTQEAVGFLRELFASPDAPGAQMAARATEGLEVADEITTSCALLSKDLLSRLAESSVN